MKFGQIAILALAVLAVGAIALAGRGGRQRRRPGHDHPADGVVEKAPAGAVEVHFAYSPEKEPLLKEQIAAFNALRREGRRQAGVRARGDRQLGRRRGADRRRQLQAGRLVAGVEPVGAAAELRGRPRAGARREPVDRAHAAGDRDVGADDAGARLPEEEDRVRRHPAARAVRPGLGRVRAAGVRQLQARAHEPGLLHQRAVRGRSPSTTRRPARRRACARRTSPARRARP